MFGWTVQLTALPRSHHDTGYRSRWAFCVRRTERVRSVGTSHESPGRRSGLVPKYPKASFPSCQRCGSGSCLASQGVRVRTYVAVRWAPLR
jgi:hypothetical protein